MALTSAEPRAQRWSRIRGERREQILQGASRVLAREGLERASMAMVAQACAATKVTVYAHFRSKELLVAEVLQRWLSAMERAVGMLPTAAADSLQEVLWRVAAVLEPLVVSDAYHALSRAAGETQSVPLQIGERWQRRFDQLRRQLIEALYAAGAADAAAEAEMFLLLLELRAPVHGAAPIVRLFQAARSQET